MQIQPIIKVPVSYLYTKTFFFTQVCACMYFIGIYQKTAIETFVTFKLEYMHVTVCCVTQSTHTHTHILSPSLFFFNIQYINEHLHNVSLAQ